MFKGFSMKENKKIDHKNKFTYKKGDLKIIKPKKKVREGLISFTEFLFEKEVKFNDATMRWITIHDASNRRQHVLISKKDGTILAGMGGKHNGEQIKSVFKDFDEEKHKGFDKAEALTGEAIHYECSLEDHVKLSRQEKKHIMDYSGQMYEDVNGCLRNYDALMMAAEEEDDDDPLYGYSGMTVHELVEYADVISSALKKHRTPKPIVTYRGISEDFFNERDIDLEVGTELWDYGFASTSSDIDIAERFRGEGYIMEVHIPKGSRAASIDSLSNFAGDEKEVLVDRGACFTIKEVDKKKKRLVVELSHEED